MQRSIQWPTLLFIAFTSLSPGAQAKLSEAEIARLDQDLTPIGAQRAGNADGSIPAWSGKWRGAPPHVKFTEGGQYPDPYADEKPLFSITSQNLAQYQERLSPGQVALFKRYPSTYRMDIYPSHRDFRYQQMVEDNIRANARHAQLLKGGDTIQGAWGGSPFPIPKSGQELVKNLQLQARGPGSDSIYTYLLTYANGKQAKQVQQHLELSNWFSPRGEGNDFANEVMTHFMQIHLEPARALGEITFGQEYIDPLLTPRQSWQYNPGTRRIRRAPNVGYDSPSSGSSGSVRVTDDNRLFNGATDRFDWAMKGQRELFIPYHNYRLDDAGLKFADLTATLGHPNPDFIRYELHRVWELEATLKPGTRHIYSKRVLYLDEDSWSAVVADNYDSRGVLWRSNLQTTVYTYDTQVIFPRVSIYQDLVSGAYLVDRLTNEQRAPRMSQLGFSASDFTPAAVRKRAQ